uniref:hypoxia-inducible factor-proline dioxygenase n=1 Tax=Romanomermis culicivorax TaxID=13658 RepID=A0A915L3M8_ROMCU
MDLIVTVLKVTPEKLNIRPKFATQCANEQQRASDHAEEKFDHAMNPPVNLSTDRRFIEQIHLKLFKKKLLDIGVYHMQYHMQSRSLMISFKFAVLHVKILAQEVDTVSKNSSCKNQSRRMLGNSVHNQFDNRIRRIAHCVSASLKRYGWVVFDHLLGQIHSQHILEDVKTIYDTPGKFHDGRLVKTKVGSQSTDVRSDKIYWFDNKVDGELVNIGFLIVVLDAIMSRLVDMPCELTGRSKAMVACYPAGGTKYVKHVDNPNGDGRRITAIYYLNQDWKTDDGGILRLYPETALNPVDIEPLADRLVFFWSDARNPHEVLPSFKMRFAVTVWYFDKAEREAARAGPSGNRSSNSRNQE